MMFYQQQKEDASFDEQDEHNVEMLEDQHAHQSNKRIPATLNNKKVSPQQQKHNFNHKGGQQ